MKVPQNHAIGVCYRYSDSEDLVVANWQEMISSVLDFMSAQPDRQLEVMMCALQSAPVPWSPVISFICDKGLVLASQRQLVDVEQRFNEQSKLAKLKTILRKFSCMSFNVSGREAER